MGCLDGGKDSDSDSWSMMVAVWHAHRNRFRVVCTSRVLEDVAFHEVSYGGVLICVCYGNWGGFLGEVGLFAIELGVWGIRFFVSLLR